ncbi:hypothetical protein JCM10213_001021 [Rhodosporidiobolus nylandii]
MPTAPKRPHRDHQQKKLKPLVTTPAPSHHHKPLDRSNTLTSFDSLPEEPVKPPASPVPLPSSKIPSSGEYNRRGSIASPLLSPTSPNLPKPWFADAGGDGHAALAKTVAPGQSSGTTSGSNSPTATAERDLGKRVALSMRQQAQYGRRFAAQENGW